MTESNRNDQTGFSSTEIRELMKNDLGLCYSLPCSINSKCNDTHCFVFLTLIFEIYWIQQIEETDITGEGEDGIHILLLTLMIDWIDLHQFQGEYLVHTVKIDQLNIHPKENSSPNPQTVLIASIIASTDSFQTEEDPHEADSQIVSEESSEESKEGTVEDILQVNLYDYISKVIEDRVWCFSSL